MEVVVPGFRLTCVLAAFALLLRQVKTEWRAVPDHVGNDEAQDLDVRPLAGQPWQLADADYFYIRYEDYDVLLGEAGDLVQGGFNQSELVVAALPDGTFIGEWKDPLAAALGVGAADYAISLYLDDYESGGLGVRGVAVESGLAGMVVVKVAEDLQDVLMVEYGGTAWLGSGASGVVVLAPAVNMTYNTLLDEEIEQVTLNLPNVSFNITRNATSPLDVIMVVQPRAADGGVDGEPSPQWIALSNLPTFDNDDQPNVGIDSLLMLKDFADDY